MFPVMSLDGLDRISTHIYEEMSGIIIAIEID